MEETNTMFTFDKDGINEFLKKKGLNPNQMKAAGVRLIIQGVTDNEISTSATAREEISELERKIDQADAKAGMLARGVQSVEERYSRIKELLEQTEKATAERTISDPTLVDSVNAFTRMLESVRDTFGEEHMTENVICAAIEAGSYGYWRSVMGPKTEGEAKRRHESRRII